MVTSAILYHLMWMVNITIDIRNVCVFLAPFFSSLTTIITYLLTKEVKVCITLISSFMYFSNLLVRSSLKKFPRAWCLA